MSVFLSRMLRPRTTRSWDFLRFSRTVNRNPPLESDVVVGMIDNGIWPESDSFHDEGIGPPPRKWKDACVNLKCNKYASLLALHRCFHQTLRAKSDCAVSAKSLGARFYNSYKDASHEASPRDFDGHGFHTSSTVAGRSVRNASMYGLEGGTARGAVYKGCATQDILAAFDDAIADGVDIISLSLSYAWVQDCFEDEMTIGAFHAMKKGVLTSAAGGNDGPDRGSVANVAPWMLVSAASTIDRRIIDKLVIGSEQRPIEGKAIHPCLPQIHLIATT